MKMLRITGCSDSSFWYAGKVGDVVQLIGLDRDEWITREPAGFVNIVKHCDAEVVNVVAAEPETMPQAFHARARSNDLRQMQDVDNYRQLLEFEVISPSAPSEHTVESLVMSVRNYIAQWLSKNASESRICSSDSRIR